MCFKFPTLSGHLKFINLFLNAFSNEFWCIFSFLNHVECPRKIMKAKFLLTKKFHLQLESVGMQLEPLFFVGVVSVLGRWLKFDFFKPSSDLGKKILSLRKILWSSRLRTVAFKNLNEHVWRNVGDVISSYLLACLRHFLTRQKYGSECQSKQKTIFVSSTNQQSGLALFFPFWSLLAFQQKQLQGPKVVKCNRLQFFRSFPKSVFRIFLQSRIFGATISNVHNTCCWGEPICKFRKKNACFLQSRLRQTGKCRKMKVVSTKLSNISSVNKKNSFNH